MLDKNGYAPSIMQTNKECWVSKMQNCDLVRHEIYFGSANRKISKANGCWVWLTPYWHKLIHSAMGCKLNLRLKRECQKIYEETHTREEFRQLIGKSYL